MQTRDIRRAGRWLAVAVLAGSALLAQAQKRYDPGATDTTIKIGNTMPYSGPASVYGTVGKSAAAYFRKVNAEGGIGGRKIEFISLDDAYSPPVAVEQTRKLVEQQKVLLIFGPLGTPTNAATQKYLNIRKVPQLFVSSGAERWGDHRQFPWSIGFNPTYVTEGRIYAAHILASRPDAKVAVLYQNDEFGKDIVRGFLDGLGDKARSVVVAQASYEVSDPTVDSQIISLRSSGADTLMNFSQTKFAAQTIRKMAAIGWKPAHYLTNVSNSVAAVLKPAGAEHAKGLLTATYLRDPSDGRDTPEGRDFAAFMKQYYPEGDPNDTLNVTGYSMAQALVQLLTQAGDDLTRANLMKQAASLDMTLPMLYPGIRLKTGPDNFYPIRQMQLVRFDGTGYEKFGDLLGP
ncbi:ABC transporter substrate-binding protein [Variovorax ginsengisoli]|uniref:ABC transporter substrate-binding protein n=1 Tax=Variovorax ginsengisoli TaxID=363844 RepID=A0ABT8SH06_9BURK|nr:ABC transporter substrate-binding protein [Variovorax ginsengisoli]MDN8617611.1 ABC transporter substrate-binding protein [Variovorax ginsengisoli]MDO1536781.1 ABC transporter substrate-binding protein [Variovorax ginsengisoli]